MWLPAAGGYQSRHPRHSAAGDAGDAGSPRGRVEAPLTTPSVQECSTAKSTVELRREFLGLALRRSARFVLRDGERIVRVGKEDGCFSVGSNEGQSDP